MGRITNRFHAWIDNHRSTSQSDAQILRTWDHHIASQNQEKAFLQGRDFHQNLDSLHFLTIVLNDTQRLTDMLVKFEKDVEALFLLIKTALYMHKSVAIWIWERCIVPRNREIDYLDAIGRDDGSYWLLNDTNEGKALIRKYSNDPHALATCFKQLIPIERNNLWYELVEPQNLEIEFIREVELPDHTDICDIATFEGQVRIPAIDPLIEKYRNSTEALAVIWNLVNPNSKQELWNQILVPEDREIDFIKQIGAPGAPTALTVRCNLPKSESPSDFSSKGIEPLVEKYKDDLEALAVIWRILEERDRNMFLERFIIPNGWQAEFMSLHLNDIEGGL